MRIERRGQEFVVELSGELSVAEARALHTDLVAQVPAGSDVVMCCGDVVRVDGAVLQLVTALAAHAGAFRVDTASAAWTEACGAMGLDSPTFTRS